MRSITHCLNHNRHLAVDVEELTALELMGKIIDAFNGNVKEINDYFQEANNKFDKGKAQLEYLLGSGLNIEVVKKINEMYANGDLSHIINDGVFDLINSKIDQNYLNVKYYGCKGDGVTDDTVAIKNVITLAEQTGATVFFPTGTYIVSETIYYSLCNIKGASSSGFTIDGDNNKCSVIKAKDEKQYDGLVYNHISNDGITFKVEGIVLTGFKTGLKTSYTVNCEYDDLFINNCVNGWEMGDITMNGALFNTVNNLYTQNIDEYGLIIKGKSVANNNVFNNSYISGKYGAVRIECVGGFGAVNNTFNQVEFRSHKIVNEMPMGGRGIELIRAVNTTFNQCYFETQSAHIYADTLSSFTENECIFGSFRTDNFKKDVACIIATNVSANVEINGGCIFLLDVAYQKGVTFINTAVPTKLLISKYPRKFFTDTTFKWANISSCKRDEFTEINVISKGSPKFVMKNEDEDYGFEITRSRGSGSTSDYGVLFKFLNTLIFTINSVSKQMEIADKLKCAKGLTSSKDIQITGSANGVILQSVGGKLYRLRVSDTGTVETEEVTQ